MNTAVTAVSTLASSALSSSTRLVADRPCANSRCRAGIQNLRVDISHSTGATSWKRDALLDSSRTLGGRRLQRMDNLKVQCTAVEPRQADRATEKAPPAARRRVVGRGSRFIGCGSAVPKKVITNDDLSQYIDTSDEWIASRTGIRKRRVLSEGETLVGLAVEASKRALEMAELEPNDIDLVILCTSTPEDIFGSAVSVKQGLGITNNCVAHDLTAACSGFVLGLVSATQYIRGSSRFRNVLVIGADALSRFVDWSDRGTCILFGDGAGALIVQAAEGDEDNLLAFDMHSDGGGSRHLHAAIGCAEAPLAADGTASVSGSEPASFPPRQGRYQNIQMNGREVFKFAVKAVPQVVESALQEAGLTSDHLDWLLLHQANQRILDAAAERLKIPAEKVISNLSEYGNTSAASIPLALDEAVRAGKVRPGHVVASAGFGAGLTWASAILKWG